MNLQGMYFLRDGDPRLAKRNNLLGVSDSRGTEIEEIQSANTPMDETRIKVKAAISTLLGRINTNPFAYFHATGQVLSWAQLPESIDFGLYCLLEGPDVVLEKIMATIEAQGLPVGLPAAEREQRIAELKREQRAAEIGAEREAMRLESEGFSVLRRPNVDLDMLLALWGEESTAPAAAAQSAAAAA